MSTLQAPNSNTLRSPGFTTKQLRYRRRKLAGNCCYGNCSTKAQDGRAYCRSHLRHMVGLVSTIYKRRADQKLCFKCGARPQFWGKRCVLCRQLVAKNPLPTGARRALRQYREREVQGSRETSREIVRIVARTWVAEGKLTSRQKEAVELYLGLEDDGWRTYQQVAQLMHLSGERVRQLLLPSKVALALVFGEKAPWRRVKKNRER